MRSEVSLNGSEGGTVPRDSVNAPRVVIVGGGFGGVAASRVLAGSKVQVTLLDRLNHHLFQPLLYQVATAALSPSNIAAPTLDDCSH